MAVFTMTSCFISIGTTWTGTAPGDPGTQTVSGTLTGTDLSTMTTSLDLSLQAEELDYTNFGSGGWRQKISGLKMGTLQLNFNQDFAASKIDALFGIGGSLMPFGGSGSYYFEIKATSSARSATNPSYVGQLVPIAYTPISGAVGDLATLSVQLPTTGQIARLTA